MINQSMYRLGSGGSLIFQLFSYGLKQAQIVGKENVYDYSLGNPSIPAPPEVGDAICDIVRTEDSLTVHGYTPAAGYDGLRKAVAEDLNRRFGADARPQDLFFTAGAAPAMVAVVRALETEHSEIVAIAPFFPEYRPFVEANGSKLTVVPADTENFQISMPGLAAAVNENTQAVIINSPNNPSGVVYTEETLKKVAALLEERSAAYGHPIYLIADEPYRELVYGDAVVPFVPLLYKNTVVCYSWSKSLSMPGERIGYVYVPQAAEDGEALMAAVAGASRIMGQVCPPSLIQRVIERCVQYPPDLKAYDANRMLLYTELTKMGYEMPKPDGAFYLFIKAPNGDSESFMELAKKRNLLIVPGTGFGCREYFRICYAVSNDMIRRSLPVFKAVLEEATH